MHGALYDGLKEEIEEAVRSLLKRGGSPYDTLTKALVEGMRIVGIDFRDGILFVPEVLLAANAMKAGMAILRPILAETGAQPIGKVVIGTVKGDIHDIGKNLVAMMLEGAGFEVVDLGINTDADKFIAALEEHTPDILGMSALLTPTMPDITVVSAHLTQRGMRADCGTGGLLDRVLEEEGVERLPGAHCYEVYAGSAAFAALADEEPGTFYLTDYLVRSFEALVIRGLGLDRHPELLPVYFGNYRRVVYLAQADDPILTERAELAARRLGLAFERRLTGVGELGPAIRAFAGGTSAGR